MTLRSMLAAVLGVAAVSLPAAAQPAGPAIPPPPVRPAAQSQIQTPQAVPTLPDTPGAPQLNRADLERWLDGYMPYALQRGDVAGAVVVVVKDGQVLLQKGYGYSDVAKKTPVDPERTLFRPGSVAKLFTWTAVMQLVEQGKLDLDADVNRYIDFKIPARDGKPITLRNIMTHTPGFEEAIKGLMSNDPKGPAPLGPYLKTWTPTRIFAPGEVPAYSNYATALAGYIVERVGGEKSYDDYIERHILQPLGMAHSSFRQPLPANLQPLMSKGYVLGSGEPKYYEMVGPAPAGSMAATGSDMARFMIAHLQKGTYNGVQILKPETADQMHTSGLDIVPGVNRMVLGFFDTPYNGHRVIGHGGDSQWFHSYLHLFLDDNVGLYVSMNSSGKAGAAGAIRSALFENFADRYFPADPIKTTVDAKLAAEHARMMAGLYQSSRRPETSMLSLIGLAGQTKVVVNPDGTLTVAGVNTPGGAPIKWREVRPFLWQAVGGKTKLGAQVKDGKLVQFSFDDVSPFTMWQPIAASKSGAWLTPALLASLAALTLTALLWPATALARRRYGHRFALEGTPARTYRLVRIASIAAVLVFVATGATIVSMMSDLANISSALDGWLWTLHILSLVVFIGGTMIALWNLATVWRGGRSWFAKLWSVVLALSFLVLLWVAIAFHLIGFSVNF